MRRYAADYFCRCDEIMLCRCMPRKSPMMPAARRICLSALENDYLGVAAVAAVAAYEYKAGVGDHAVADTEIGEFYLCSEIDIMVAQQTHPLAAGSGILEIDILSGKLVQRKRVRQSLGFKQRIYLIEQLSAKLVICRPPLYIRLRCSDLRTGCRRSRHNPCIRLFLCIRRSLLRISYPLIYLRYSILRRMLGLYGRVVIYIYCSTLFRYFQYSVFRQMQYDRR